MENLHGTPAKVVSKLDQKEYHVIGVHYDGDAKGYVIKIVAFDFTHKYLYPGQYRTKTIYVWQDDSKKLVYEDLL